MALDLYRIKESLRDLSFLRRMNRKQMVLAGVAVVAFLVAGYMLLFRGSEPPALTRDERATVQAVDAAMPDDSKSFNIPVREPGSGRVPVQAPPR